MQLPSQTLAALSLILEVVAGIDDGLAVRYLWLPAESTLPRHVQEEARAVLRDCRMPLPDHRGQPIV
jgi:hypothetical protein